LRVVWALPDPIFSSTMNISLLAQGLAGAELLAPMRQ
jgi:hypothetical protein